MENYNSNENYLLKMWLEDMKKTSYVYKEPILDVYAIKFIKSICHAFQQDVHVFIMSVDLLEEYIRRKHEEEFDEILAIMIAILISNKCVGTQTNVKITNITALLLNLTGTHYTNNQIVKAELEIYQHIDNYIPITTIVDDVNTFVENFARDSQLLVDIRSLCLDILEVVYILRKEWFFDVKKMYDTKPALKVFRNLMENKLYLPVCILISALRLTKYRNTLNINSILLKLTKITKIHSDHINILSDKITNVIDDYDG